MASHATLPLELRLDIYERCLAHCFDAPGICMFPGMSFDESDLIQSHLLHLLRILRWRLFRVSFGFSHPFSDGIEYVREGKVKLPVPSVLQAESGDVRSHLLKWLAKHRGIKPGKSAPTLRFRDRAYIPEHDFLYLESPRKVQEFSKILDPKDPSSICGIFGPRIRRIALPASIRHTESLPLFLFLQRLDTLPGLRELAFAFVELDHGELKIIDSVPKTDPAAYTLERLGDGDIPDYRRKLSRSIEGLETFIRPMLGGHSRNLKITACKMIPRC
ncbi:hypothetical protein INS49_009848 [Diaporthe citri]|uniref:uncharacterized protein n=1 Tax=Diaporthe citri TaxID=83186 RepID=UPI001C80859B|nr:uncharacterized protein INS49_009848 [Diaporthe citri]KAG6361621.1 hypothetical protein INS49_009848 [Diaporthe citri]